MKNDKDIRSTIQKLLNLAHDKGATEAESQAALLKAKELMMKYNLDNVEVSQSSNNTNSRDVKRYMTDITFTKRTEVWIADLAHLIAKNSRCMSFFTHGYGDQKRTIGFYGYDEDLQICVVMFNYALYCIWDHFPEIRNNLKEKYGFGIKQSRPYTDGYAIGFITGMRDAFEKQYEEHKQEWGLVALTPTAVIEYVENKVTSVDLGKGPSIDRNSYHQGVKDGKKWKPQSTLYNTGIEG